MTAAMAVLTLIAYVTVLLAVYVPLLVRDWKRWDPGAHTADCLTWRPIGIHDNTCPAPHPTDWFTTESETTK